MFNADRAECFERDSATVCSEGPTYVRPAAKRRGVPSKISPAAMDAKKTFIETPFRLESWNVDVVHALMQNDGERTIETTKGGA
jgi:hypothetical protein